MINQLSEPSESQRSLNPSLTHQSNPHLQRYLNSSTNFNTRMKENLDVINMPRLNLDPSAERYFSPNQMIIAASEPANVF